MIRRAALAPITLLLAACSGAAPAPAGPVAVMPPPAIEPASAAPPAPTAEKLAADAPRATAAGTTFTAPGGWTLRSDGSKRFLDGPEPDIHLALVDVGAADSPEAAVAAAWPALVPDFKRTVKLAADRAARHGWEQHKGFWYETSPDERLFFTARAFRKARAWTVLLVSSSEPSLGKRNAQIGLVINSLRPTGYTRETFQGRTAHALDTARVRALTDFVETARVQAGVPGVAVSLFTTDSVIFEGGFGVREMGKGAPVSADTLFVIASNTKALTTLLLAKLVDEGKLTWDAKVTSVYPAFKLGDADLTGRLAVKHLVCMCTGLPREEDVDWAFAFQRSSPKGVLDLLGTMRPTSGFGELFQYTDVLPAAAGFIGGAVLHPKRELGAAYDEAMMTRVLRPLGMTSTTFDFAEATRKDHASPHAEDFSGKPAVAAIDVDRAALTPVRPAGGAWSNVKDLRRYVQMELAKGMLPDSHRFISEEALLARRAPQIAMGPDETYAMGLMVDTQLGIPVVHHGGYVVGYRSDFFWLPEHGTGGVILTNADSGSIVRRSFLRRTLEVLFDGNPEAAEDVTLAVAERKEWLAKERAQSILPADPRVVANLAERYTSPDLGDIVVRTDAKGTVFVFDAWKSAVASRKNDHGTTALVTVDPGVNGFDFVVADQGSERRLVLRDPQHEHVFREAGLRKASTSR
ncbi:Beta-lactamase [Minicystis rosea]|nr:Beta-lactamase [Minicystis rosea]